MTELLKKVSISIEFKGLLNLYFEDILKELSKTFLLTRHIPFKESTVDITGPIAILNDFVVIYRLNTIILLSFGRVKLESLKNVFESLMFTLSKVFDRLSSAIHKITIDFMVKGDYINNEKLLKLMGLHNKVDEIIGLKLRKDATIFEIFKDLLSDVYFIRIIMTEEFSEKFDIVESIKRALKYIKGFLG